MTTPRGPPIPWTRRFRPSRFQDVCGNETTVKIIQRLARKALALPPLILTGPVGCGKTTLTHCLVRNLRPLPTAVVQVHSYDDVQENTFRDRMHFLVARLTTLSQEPSAYALVVIENVDSMTNAFQMAVSRLFEDKTLYQRVKFVFTCTKPHLLLAMLTSRCLALPLTSLDDVAIQRLARRIAKKAKMPLSHDAVRALRYVVSGDARLLVRAMETLYMLGGAPKVTAQTVMALFDVPPPHHMVDALVQCLNGDSHGAWRLLQEHVLQQGYSVADCYTAIRRLLLDPDGAQAFVANTDALNRLRHLPEVVRMHIVKTLARAHMMAVQGMASHIQLTGLLSFIAHVRSS